MYIGCERMEREEEEQSIEEILSDSLTFTQKQIDYLRDEFDRQRRWVKTLSERESAALKELEQTKNSISYRIGRVLTAPLRKIEKIFKKKDKSHYFLEEKELDSYEQDLFSSFLISPGLLPEQTTYGHPDVFVQETLLNLRRDNPQVNDLRDDIKHRTLKMSNDVLYDCLRRITRHVFNSREYHPTLKNTYVAALRVLSQKEQALAVKFYREFSEIIDDLRADKTAVNVLMKMGMMNEPMKLLQSMKNDNWKQEIVGLLSPQIKLLNKGFSGEAHVQRKWKSRENVIFYNASQSLPHTSSGYATRTHGLMKGLSKLGRKMHVYLRHGYPLDRNDFKGVYENPVEVIDRIEYNFNPSNNSDGVPEINYTDIFNFSKLEEYHDICISTLENQISALKPSIIHAASNFVVGMAAVNIAKSMGIPSIYEVRGFWHITQASKRIGYADSDHFILSESLELEVASRADHVFTITQGIADILIDYGVAKEKISILPNAVDIEKFEPVGRDKELEDSLELYEKVVLGYIGSFVEYEGLDLLLQAVAKIRNEVGEYFRVILVGDGLVFDELVEMSRFLGINDIVTFTGRVPHDEVQRYYSLIDVTAFPRKGKRVCELVSPLKPFEAMAMKKAVIASDVQALAEIVDDGKTGLLHKKDDVDSLAECIRRLVLDDKLRSKLANEGRKWVEEHRTWGAVTKHVSEVYDKLLNDEQ